jgi:hypothetical protein
MYKNLQKYHKKYDILIKQLHGQQQLRQHGQQQQLQHDWLQ